MCFIILVKSNNCSQFENILLKSLTLFKFHLDISDKDNSDLQS